MTLARRKMHIGRAERREAACHDNVHRWLISYADYMTLMFALFVVLYAMAMVNEEPFEAITDSLGKMFITDEDKPLHKQKGDDILSVTNPETEQILNGDNVVDLKSSVIDEKKQSTYIIDSSDTPKQEKILSNITNEVEGERLIVVDKALNSALEELVINDLVTIELKGDWLEIALSSGLLFPSGSSSVMPSAKPILTAISQQLQPINNFVRIRGYTDNQAINTEIYTSNWELSVYRATSVLKILEELSIAPSRMAIEGYGQFQPITSNNTAEGRAKNRRVVIAVSKYGVEK